MIDDGELAEDEEEEFLNPDAECNRAQNECLELLNGLQRETPFLDPQGGNEPMPSYADDDSDLEKMACKEQLKDMLKPPEGGNSATVEPSDKMPSTLLAAMTESGCRWNSLFRFIVRLRSAKGGCDTRWISHAKNVRRASVKLNWHQLLGHPFRNIGCQ